MQVKIESKNPFGCTVFVNDGKKETEYRIYVGKHYVTIYTGLAIRRAGATGKTFHTIDNNEIKGHYKRHGEILQEIVLKIKAAQQENK